jgi:hypothetical protein
MKRLLILLLVVLFFVSGCTDVQHSPDGPVTRFDGSKTYDVHDGLFSESDSEKNERDLLLVESAPDKTQVKIDSYNFKIEQTYLENEICEVIAIPDNGHYYEEGYPNLPSIRRFVAIPPNVDYEIKILDFDEETFGENFNVCPIQPDTHDCECEGKECPLLEYTKNYEFYDSNLQYPSEVVSVVGDGVFRDYRILTVEINPVRYNPRVGEISIVTNLEFEIEYKENKIPTKNIKSEKDKKESSFENLYRDLITNYESLDRTYLVSRNDPPYNSEGADYLIILPIDYASVVSPFVELKEEQGYVVRTKYVDEIYDEYSGETDSEKVKNYIGDIYFNSDLSPTYVLLVGDVEQVPIHYSGIYAGFTQYLVATDYYYSLLDGEDLHPEVNVGRLSGNPSDVSVIIHKIIGYETNLLPSDWQNSLSLVAHPQMAPKKYQENKEEIDFDYIRGNNFEVYKTYPFFGDNSEELIHIINNAGISILNYRGHGGTCLFRDPRITNNDMLNLNNVDMLPIIFSIACSTAAIQNVEPQIEECGYDGTESLAEVSLINPNGGAVAFVGATIPTFTHVNNEFDKVLFEGKFDNNYNDISEIVTYGKERLIEIYGDNTFPNKNIFAYLIIGSPDIRTFPVESPNYDLGIDSVGIPDHILLNDPFPIDFVVKNYGTLQTDSTYLSMRYNSEEIGGAGIPSLEAGQDYQGLFLFENNILPFTNNFTLELRTLIGDEVRYNNLHRGVYVSRPFTFTGEPSDFGLDTNNNGYYDELVIQQGISYAWENGYLIASVDLYNSPIPPRRFIGHGSTTFFAQDNVSPINISIDAVGWDFFGGEKEGPYYVELSLGIGYYDGDIPDYISYYTNYYNYSEFERRVNPSDGIHR